MKIYDLVIIGSGPAGMAAAIYAKRAMLDTVLIEKEYIPGGQVIQTYEVDNYPGIPKTNGMELSDKFAGHAKDLGVETMTAEVTDIKPEGKIKEIYLKDGNMIKTKTIILATGAVHRTLDIPGEKELTGMGVSYCATCDGAFFRNKVTAVVGGGDVALEDAIFLSRICEKVYLIHRRDELRGAKILRDQVKNNDKIEILWNTVVTEIQGENKVENIHIQDVNNGVDKVLKVDGIFIAVGTRPASDLLKNQLETDSQGYIIAGEDGITNLPGIFVGGDGRRKNLRQVVTAVADGANCVLSVERYLQKL
ncbi:MULTISPECIES: thioredoxin-disulfide reductase [Anaerostipes]|uniref:thioredoxin-disulfide reductase n=1 Tax=Anaerostipes TaxID=207244 RepID=UPI000952A8FB|nr:MULTISPECIES: thioredoxin-disulfide reductase [unclassified Anaerostipes]MCI5622232.1 thioredoxin-disulfide reductase [Anaerostipes sp.]MDY2726504.1 thioredoxin-disulfide reductase [Anaerostipes faecalis]OLR59972.1 thioredoxin-disulfide reductase [Anaerostipes sp. 494a]